MLALNSHQWLEDKAVAQEEKKAWANQSCHQIDLKQQINLKQLRSIGIKGSVFGLG